MHDIRDIEADKDINQDTFSLGSPITISYVVSEMFLVITLAYLSTGISPSSNPPVNDLSNRANCISDPPLHRKSLTLPDSSPGSLVKQHSSSRPIVNRQSRRAEASRNTVELADDRLGKRVPSSREACVTPFLLQFFAR